MNLNFENWKMFNFTDIFIIKKGFYNKKPESSISGNIPFLGASDSNNGITGYYTLDEIMSASKTGDEPNEPIEKKLFPAHAVCVTNNGSVGYAYYQGSQFSCSHDVNPLYRKDENFNEFTGLFIASVIMHDRYRWGYGRKWRPDRMSKSRIMLPSTNLGNPDWLFMENYIKSLNCKPISSQNRNTLNGNLINKNWKEFNLGSLLKDGKIYKAKAHSKIELESTDIIQEGFIHFVSRTEANNGIDCYALESDVSNIEDGNAITIGDTTATIAYQTERFVTGDHMIVIRAEWLNKYTGLFIVSLLQRERFRYSYGRAFLMDSIKSTKLLLPVLHDSKGIIINKEKKYSPDGYIPDWQWMEKYIKALPYSDRI